MNMVSDAHIMMMSPFFQSEKMKVERHRTKTVELPYCGSKRNKFAQCEEAVGVQNA